MTTSKRLAEATKPSRPSRTKSNRSKIYVAIPPPEGWPVFTGQNWAAFGLRRKG